MKRSVLYLIIGLILLVVVLLLLSLINKTKQSPIPLKQAPAATTPTPQTTTHTKESPSPTIFKVTGNSLPTSPLGTTDSFSITFSKPISYKEFDYVIEPPAAVNVSLNSQRDTATISPQHTWGFNASYQLTIKKDTRSLDGTSLNEDFILNFKSVPFAGY